MWLRRHQSELVFGKPRLMLRRTHVGPKDAAAFDQGIRTQFDFRAKAGCFRLRRQFDTLPGHVVFPAVVRTAQTAFLVAAEPERYAAMRAELVDQAEASFGVAKCDQPLRQQLHAHRRAVVLRQFLGQQSGDPVAPEHLAHRRALTGLGQKVILFRAQHDSSRGPRWLVAASQPVAKLQRAVSGFDLYQCPPRPAPLRVR